MNKSFTQAVVAIIGMTGLAAATIITLFIPDMGDERQLLLGGLIASGSAASAWLFRLNGAGAK